MTVYSKLMVIGRVATNLWLKVGRYYYLSVLLQKL